MEIIEKWGVFFQALSTQINSLTGIQPNLLPRQDQPIGSFNVLTLNKIFVYSSLN
ncbi:MAG: hypothetical protein V1833_05475 [Elusimicrobiota bacterium]